MTVDRHPDWFDVVRERWRDTTGFLLATRGPCLGIRDEELRAVRGRSLASRDASDLERWVPPKSWLLGVILCPGDSIDAVIAWVRRGKLDADRIRFYLHPSTPPEALRPWLAAGFDTGRVAVVSDWKELHKLYGLALNERVYADWSAEVEP